MAIFQRYMFAMEICDNFSLYFLKYSIWEHGILLYFKDRCFRTNYLFK